VLDVDMADIIDKSGAIDLRADGRSAGYTQYGFGKEDAHHQLDGLSLPIRWLHCPSAHIHDTPLEYHAVPYLSILAYFFFTSLAIISASAISLSTLAPLPGSLPRNFA